MFDPKIGNKSLLCMGYSLRLSQVPTQKSMCLRDRDIHQRIWFLLDSNVLLDTELPNFVDLFRRSICRADTIYTRKGLQRLNRYPQSTLRRNEYRPGTRLL